MIALIDYIQIEIHKTYNKKYSKKYIENKLIPIINSENPTSHSEHNGNHSEEA